MRIVLNGEPLDVPAGLSIRALLDRLGVDHRIVAVERNRVVIKRARYADTSITDDDEIEIVAFVGGG